VLLLLRSTSDDDVRGVAFAPRIFLVLISRRTLLEIF
jgi:hypothetical protein